MRWIETRQRAGYDAEYVTIGSMPGLIRDSFKDDATVQKLLCDSVVLSRRNRKPKKIDEHPRLVSALVLKLLQRGRMPLPTLEIERTAIGAFDLDQRTTDLSAAGDIELGWETKSGKRYKIDRGQFIARLSERRRFELEPGFQQDLIDSSYELDFLTRWVPRNLGDDAGHWVTPQAPLDTLIETSRDEMHSSGAGRRVDFLFHAPGWEPFILEIDGPEHQQSVQIDQQRDRSLRRATGMDVIRITNQEVTPGPSATLEQIKQRFGVADQTDNAAPNGDEVTGHARFADFARACSIASKIQFVIARALDRRWLSGDVWSLEISGAGPCVSGAVLDALRMISAYDALYGGKSRPDRCVLRTGDGIVRVWKWHESDWINAEVADNDAPHLSILVESDSSPYDEITQRGADFIIRPAFLPVDFSVDLHANFPRKPIEAETLEVAEPALTFLLQNVFRKRSFRQGQALAIWRTLRQEDTIVLLPTGGGKSIIYQLAGLLMPGITMVIDPIVALIEDQVEGLRRYGIERVTGISSALNQTERQTVLSRAERGEFQFILMAPERLQSPEFRGTVGALRSSSLINLAVIDEAHCVSEWGHEFRPAYLRLAETLRDICRDMRGAAPPLLALTGTASRAVLRDMMIELVIDQSKSDNVVRPTSFDRQELKFEILREKTLKTGMDALRGAVQNVPHKLSESPASFFNPRGRETSSGIVFIRTVKPRDWGLNATKQVVTDVTRAAVVTYSGGAVPEGNDRHEWEQIKRENARKFKDNEVPILVATKAFGMGIDKPNIRFVIHNGMPGSIESFYQEAGRAGRDGKTALCIAVTSEFQKKRSDDWLDGEADLEEIRASFRRSGNDWDRSDDVTTALYFHLNSFRGVSGEIDQVGNVLNQLGDLTEENSVKISFGAEAGQKRIEYAVVRLLRVGIVSDYTVDWNRRQLSVNVPRFDFEHCKSTVVEHIRLAQPWRTSVFAQRVESIADKEPRESAMALVSVLIEFTYDAIERGRRQAIREAVELARNASEDADIRRRIIDYLEEGVHTQRIDELLSKTKIDLDEWYQLILKVHTAVDAGGLRGLTARRLESDADHPGLRFTRGASEAMCSDRADLVGIDHFNEGVQASVKYGVEPNHISKLIADLYEFGENRAPMLLPLLTWGLLQLDSNEEQYRMFRSQAFDFARNSQQPQTAAAGVTSALADAVDQAADAVTKWQNRYNYKCLQLLGIAER